MTLPGTLVIRTKSCPHVGPNVDNGALARDIKNWGQELGFQEVAIAGIDLRDDEAHLQSWLAHGFHGEMGYMKRHGTKRSRPDNLMPGALRVISVRMDYWPATAAGPKEVLSDPELGYVSRYALGRDYHKVLKQRLDRLAKCIQACVGDFGYRVFVDSAPVLEKALARNAGLGWIGKHTNLIHPKRGSWFFLGEIYTNLPLPIDPAYTANHCGRCTACLDVCPTRAIIALTNWMPAAVSPISPSSCVALSQKNFAR